MSVLLPGDLVRACHKTKLATYGGYVACIYPNRDVVPAGPIAALFNYEIALVISGVVTGDGKGGEHERWVLVLKGSRFGWARVEDLFKACV